VLLFHQEDDGSMRFACTATSIGYNPKQEAYIFATAAHCINDKHQPFISLDEVGTDKVFVRSLSSSCGSEEMGDDVCLLFVRTKTHFEIVDLGDDPLSGEPIVSVESPAGMGKQILHGYVALSKLDRTIHDKESKLDWTGDVILQLPGVLGGSSGASVICESSQKICAFTVGVYAGDLGQMQVAVPVSRLKKLLDDTANKKEPKASIK
jgi:hypothetical protein